MTTFTGNIVDYMINAPCNLKCPFCYGPDPNLRAHLDLGQKKELLARLKGADVKRIVIAGGEPTLDKDLFEFCKTAFSLGVNISLQTNGTFPERVKMVLPFIDWIALPLDGISAAAQLKMRTDLQHYEKFKKMISVVKAYAKTTSAPIRIKVGTVISKYNIAELDEIAGLLAKIGIDSWKLYRVRKRGKGVDSFDELVVDDDIVVAEMKRISTKHPCLNANYSCTEETHDSYIIIDPDSSTYVITGSAQKQFGKLFEGKLFLTEKLSEILLYSNRDLILENINKSFPGWI